MKKFAFISLSTFCLIACGGSAEPADALDAAIQLDGNNTSALTCTTDGVYCCGATACCEGNTCSGCDNRPTWCGIIKNKLK